MSVAPLLGLTENVQIAIITLLSVVLAATIANIVPAWMSRSQAKKGAEEAKRGADAIGEPNGHGTVVEMMHKILDRSDRTDDRILHMREDIAALATRVETLERQQALSLLDPNGQTQ
jgi:uncharacterized membrane protein